MKGLLITLKGGELAAKKELEGFELENLQIREGCVLFDFEDYEVLFQVCYYSQTAYRILLLDPIYDFLKEGMSFRVRGEHNERAKILGSEINEELKFKVDLNNPDIPLYYYNDHIGVDFTGDISKRDYRIFTNRHTLKGVAAAILLIEAGLEKGTKILDCFAQDGTIIIEAVHMLLGRSVRFYNWEDMNFIKFKCYEDFDFESLFAKDEFESDFELNATSPDLRNINAIKKNSKIAGVNKYISFAKKEIEYLDQKFENEDVDLLVTYLPKLNLKQTMEFFHQIEFVAKKWVILVDNKNSFIDNNYFSVENEKTLTMGNTKRYILWLKKI